MRVVTGSQMKQMEEASLKYDMTYQRLMENAGAAAAAFIRRTFAVEGLNCMVFCGSGNNGGDGFVVARKLIENGANVLVVLVGGPPGSAEARAMFGTIELMGMPVLNIENDYEKMLGTLQKADIVIDAIYGTGFRGELGAWAKTACGAINDAIAAVVSLDVPSGVECDSTRAADGAVRADFTVAFDSFKPVHIFSGGKEYCGKIEAVEIGIPDEARKGISSLFREIGAEDVFKSLPKRAENSHKGDHGKLLIIAGSNRYRGCASLAVMSALRCGTGLVTLASTKPVCDAAAAKLHECVYIELPESSAAEIEARSAISLTHESLAAATAVLFGCGVGLSEDSRALMAHLVRTAKCPLILDADGINALATHINVLKEAAGPVILTPHPGEMARLCGMPVEDVERERYGVAAEFAREHNVHLVLKGHETVVASPGSGMLINRTGNAGLAKAGSGDALAGMIAAFSAQGLSPLEACAAGVHLHGMAADEAAKELSQYAMLPSDLPNYLAKILQRNDR